MYKAYRRNFLIFPAFISATSFCLTFWWTSEELGFSLVSFVNHPETHLKSFLLSNTVLTCLSTSATCGTKQLRPQGWTGLRAPSVSVWGVKQCSSRKVKYISLTEMSKSGIMKRVNSKSLVNSLLRQTHLSLILNYSLDSQLTVCIVRFVLLTLMIKFIKFMHLF